MKNQPTRDVEPSLLGRIRGHYRELPESERRIADLILEFPGEVAAYSATELAQLSGSSKAAVTRLIRRLGYNSFDEARRMARKARSWGSPLYMLSSTSAPNSFDERVRLQIEQDLLNMRTTLEALDETIFDEVVEAVCTARRVFFFGYRNSRYLAIYMRQQIIQVRGELHILSDQDGALAEGIADLAPTDLLVTFGFRRRRAHLGRAMAAAQAAGTRILYFTDWTAKPAAEATWNIPCALGGPELFDRYAATMSLIHLLCVAVVERLDAEGRSRLQRIEDLHEELHDFD